MRDPESGHHPPRFAVRLLRAIIDKSLFDDIYGDLYEIYIDRLSERGRFHARLYFILDVIASIRNYNLRRKHYSAKGNSLAMIGNYFKSTFRNIAKNKTYTILNILGLALGIAACLFILQYVSYERSYDRFHENYEDIYRVTYKVYRDGELNIDCAAAVPRVGPFMKEKMPEVIDYARVYPMSGMVSYGNVDYREPRMHMTDPSFLKIFTFPLIAGDPETALAEPYAVVITKEIAHKYFGREDPMGKILRLNGEHNLEVTGVTENVPDNSHFKYDFLVSYATLNSWNTSDEGEIWSETSWGWYDFNTYVQLRSGTDPEDFNRRFDDAVVAERHEDFEKYNFKSEFPLQPIGDIHLYSNLLQESEPEEQGDGRAVELLTLIAFFILVIAWINYINLSTSRSVDRAREVGVRKTLGASRRQLMGQFLTEAFVLNGLASILALVVVASGIRSFNHLTDSRLDLSFLSDPMFWSIMGIILIGGTFLSGVYPAIVLSSFNPVSVLKGRLANFNSDVLLRRSLVLFQFVASIGLIAGTIIVYQQLRHMRQLDLGFEMTDMLVVKGPMVRGIDSLFEGRNESFKQEMKANAKVVAITGGTNIPGEEIFWTNSIRRQDQPENANKIIYNVAIDYDYLPTYEIDVIAGRNFDRGHRTDTGSVMINEATVSYLGFQSPEMAVNEKVFFWGRPWTVIGVVEDYNQMTAKAAVSPLIFHLRPAAASFYTVKLRGDDYRVAFNNVQNLYEQYYPGNAFEYFFLDDFFNRQYSNDQKFSRVFILFSCFAIFVACLGLFGLSSFNVLKRSKEIGVRKILGAKVTSIVQLLSREFLVLLIIANLISWPLVYYTMNKWLENYAERIEIGITSLALAGLVVVIVAMSTVSLKIIQAAMANPVQAIKDE